LISVNVTATGSIVVFVDPPEIRNDTLQAGSDFTVDINISDASDVYGWQVRMTWDPSILEVKRDIGYEVETNETFGHGDGGNTTFTLDNAPVVEWSETIYLNATPQSNITDYTINYAVGNVTFTAPPPNSTTITADYTWWYNIYHVYEDDFLKGPFPHDSHPYYEATEPLVAYTHTPNSSSTPIPGWIWGGGPGTLVIMVEDETDNRYARSSTNNSDVEWGALGFPTGSMDNVARLEVGIQSSTTEYNATEPDEIEIEVSNDGGTSWGPTHAVPVFLTKLLVWVDVTDDFPWTPPMLTDANFKVRMTYRQVGVETSELRVWYLPVRVSDTLIVENPSTAYDGSFDTYASFLYSQTRGNFTVYDFSHDFPSDATDPTQETSTIEQVDFNMKYWANASSTGSYKIAYYVDPSSSETVLQDWKSTETTLGNYTWTNKTEPNNGVWDWTDVSNIQIVVETDSTGADPYAFFNEYEAWVTVTYTRPTSMTKRVKDVEGRATFSAMTSGSYLGIYGNGTLATVEFEVLAYGDTILNTTNTETILFDSSTPIPQPIPFTPENGYFNNMIPGDIQGDTGGTLPDGDVDMFDFFAFADHYATVEGDPNYNILADLQGDTPGSYPYPDGDVDMFDFFAFADNYGKSI